MILQESMLMKNIKFEDMMKLFYKFELERKVFDSGFWPSSIGYNN